PEDFLPRSRRPINEMMEELNQVIDSVKNQHLNKLLRIILSGDNLDKYSRTPAGKGWHHAYIHGLLEHTLEIVRICKLMCSIHSDLNHDLLISGALLHDFGKTEELTYDSVFDYSDKGKLIGHIMIGALTVEKTASSIPNFPEELKTHLIHLVLSHQGKLEFASPVEPKTLEAIALYQADELSAKTNAYKYAIEADKNKGGRWTRFLPLAETSLFIPENNLDKAE
ncbi:MAG: 3'-5' exoribonuclease YhaM family protein, partial [Melioribacteraceae bacterium]